MSFRKVKPTKSNFLKLKNRLEFVEKGKEFLDYKREQLIHEIRNLWVNYRTQRRKYYKSLGEIMLKLNNTYKTMGKRVVVVSSGMGRIQYKTQVDIQLIKD
ncbi:MAG: V-type ATP synthase subunit D [Candidatus Lokiarchaeota archaeon]